MTATTLTAWELQRMNQDRDAAAYAAWERDTAKVEKQLRYGLISTEEATRRLVALDARLDEELA